MSERNKVLKQINKILSLGKPMTKEQERFLSYLRGEVKAKRVTVEEAKRLWNRKYKVGAEEKP